MGSEFGGYLGGLWGWFLSNSRKKELQKFKTRPNPQYWGETSCYSLLQGGVYKRKYCISNLLKKLQVQNCKKIALLFTFCNDCFQTKNKYIVITYTAFTLTEYMHILICRNIFAWKGQNYMPTRSGKILSHFLSNDAKGRTRFKGQMSAF